MGDSARILYSVICTSPILGTISFYELISIMIFSMFSMYVLDGTLWNVTWNNYIRLYSGHCSLGLPYIYRYIFLDVDLQIMTDHAKIIFRMFFQIIPWLLKLDGWL